MPKATMLDVFTNTLFDAPVYKNYGRMIVENRYRPAGFKAPVGAQGHAARRRIGDRYRVPMPS